MTAIIVKTRAELDAVRETVTGRTVLVPTMGALHEGHRSLIRHARSLGEHVVVSIFVNPLQFGPGEDLDRYPRTLAADVEMCTEEGVDAIFAPSAAEVYPRALEVTLSAGRMGTIVEGACRPGHFDGVLTVVVKLFNLVRPDIAVFGQKDAQQLAVIRRMVSDLNLPVTVEACPTVREDDGLALSSRNRFLSAEERTTALALSTALHCGLAVAGQGSAAVLTAAQAVLDKAVKATPPLELDYLVLVDAGDFTDVPPDFAGPAVLAVAGKVGTTHLIDNLPLSVTPQESQ